MKKILALTAAACLIATPLSFAQTEQTPPAPQAQQVPRPDMPPQETPQTPIPTPAPAPQTQTQAPASEPQGCRTRQPAGSPCACLSAPDQIGVSTENSSGQTICVRPG